MVSFLTTIHCSGIHTDYCLNLGEGGVCHLWYHLWWRSAFWGILSCGCLPSKVGLPLGVCLMRAGVFLMAGRGAGAGSAFLWHCENTDLPWTLVKILSSPTSFGSIKIFDDDALFLCINVIFKITNQLSEIFSVSIAGPWKFYQSARTGK